MNRLILAALPIIPLVAGCGASGSTSETERTKAAILRVLQAQQDLAMKVKDSLPPKLKPSRCASAIGEYCNALERLEMSDCPADFRVAFRHYVGALREEQAALKQLGDSLLEVVFMGAMNTLLRGEKDGGTARLVGGLRRAEERERDTWIEVEKIAARYGAAL